MKILSIGNSFSQDAQRYLSKIAENDGVDLYSVNLYIGGCSLETHYNNMITNSSDYSLEVNGISTGEFTSIKTALESEKWDFVSLQQVSSESGDYSTFNPYVKELFDYVKKLCPTAKIVLHQTWAYEDKSEKLLSTPYKSADEMYNALDRAYNECLKSLKFYGLIPSGKAMMNAIKFGIGKIHRDTFHASLGAGRYLLGLTWYKFLTGKKIRGNRFDSFDEPVTDREREIVIKAVEAAFN